MQDTQQKRMVLALCDSRFAHSKGLGVRQYLSEWMQDEMIVCDGAWSEELVCGWSEKSSH